MIVVYPPDESAASHQDWIVHVDIALPWGDETYLNIVKRGAEGPNLDHELVVRMQTKALRAAATYLETKLEERSKL